MTVERRIGALYGSQGEDHSSANSSVEVRSSLTNALQAWLVKRSRLDSRYLASRRCHCFDRTNLIFLFRLARTTTGILGVGDRQQRREVAVTITNRGRATTYRVDGRIVNHVRSAAAIPLGALRNDTQLQALNEGFWNKLAEQSRPERSRQPFRLETITFQGFCRSCEKRGWDSNSLAFNGFAELQIPQCHGCLECQRCRGALPAIGREKFARPEARFYPVTITSCVDGSGGSWSRWPSNNPSWGYTRIQGALKNLGHSVARATGARILRRQGVPPSRERPMQWRTFLRAHWSALLAADFFTTEVWTIRGLVTYYTVFVIELRTRRVHVLGSTPYPDEEFVIQTMRHLTDPVEGVLRTPSVLICDRDRKWSVAVQQFLKTGGVRVVQTPFRAPNCNAYAERFVRAIREECLDHVIPLGERHLRRSIAEFVAHYHGERNHQGLGNELIDPLRQQPACGLVRRRRRLGGILSFYYRAA